MPFRHVRVVSTRVRFDGQPAARLAGRAAHRVDLIGDRVVEIAGVCGQRLGSSATREHSAVSRWGRRPPGFLGKLVMVAGTMVAWCVYRLADSVIHLGELAVRQPRRVRRSRSGPK